MCFKKSLPSPGCVFLYLRQYDHVINPFFPRELFTLFILRRLHMESAVSSQLFVPTAPHPARSLRSLLCCTGLCCWGWERPDQGTSVLTLGGCSELGPLADPSFPLWRAAQLRGCSRCWDRQAETWTRRPGMQPRDLHFRQAPCRALICSQISSTPGALIGHLLYICTDLVLGIVNKANRLPLRGKDE